MPYGASEIADLRLSRLQKLVTKFTSAPSLRLMNMFPSSNSDSEKIKWESETGTRGMAPFKAPGAKTPQTAPHGAAKHEVYAAFWGEKMSLDERFLNNLREPGTESRKMNARAKLAKELRQLRYRCDRRKEWMFAKMIADGSFSYEEKDGLKTSVDYSIPSANKSTLGASYKWSDGASKDILSDIRDMKIQLQDSVEATGGFIGLCTQEVLRYMVEDSGVRDLLKANAFGRGDLLGPSATNVLGVRAEVLGNLLDLTLIVYDQKYTVDAFLTAAVTGGSTTTIYVDDASDFEVGATLRFHDISEGTYEEETISAVDEQAGTITVDTAPTASFKANEDKVTMTTKFLPTNKFVMFVPTVEAQPIAEYKKAPFGIPEHYGLKLDRWGEREPDLVWIRAENKGLPVLYHPDAIYQMTVA